MNLLRITCLICVFANMVGIEMFAQESPVFVTYDNERYILHEVDGIQYLTMDYSSSGTFEYSGFVYKVKSSESSILIPASIKVPCWQLGNYPVLDEYGHETGSYSSEWAQFGETTIDVVGICSGAFCNMENLTDVTLPISLKSIAGNAFNNCGLIALNIPDGVTSICRTPSNVYESSICYDCKNLKSLYIPKNLTDIWYCHPISGSGNLQTIVVDDDNPIYDSRNNCNAIIHTKSNTLEFGCNSTIVPDNVTTIGSGAFDGCKEMTTIVIPSSVTTIYDNAFWGCSSLIRVILKTSTPPVISPLMYSNPFSNASQATLYVPVGSKKTYEAADYWKEFKEIVEMEDVNIGNEGSEIFSATTNGVTMTFKITDEQAKTCQIGTGTNAAIDIATSGRVVLPITVNGYTVTAIGANAFAGTNIRSVIIPNNIVSIGDGAFRNCGGLSYVYSYIEEPFDIPASAFSGISSSADLEIIYGTKDAYLAANGWDKFEIYYDEIYFINGIRYSVNGAEPIEKGSPYTAWVNRSYWNNYEGDVVIPETFAIGNETFTVVGIDDGAFYGSGIRSVIIPKTVRSIDDHAFADCQQLQTVKSYIMVPKDESDAFLNIPSSATLYVPAGTKALYESLGGWNLFTNIVEMEEVVEPTDISTLSDAMYADAATALKGGEGTLTINLKNAQVTSGYSFDLLLPEGVTVDSYTLSSRHNGHSEAMNYNATTGVYSFAVLSLQSKELKDNDGAVWTLKLKVADGVAAGDYAVSVQNAKYSLTSGSTSVSLPDVTSLLTIEDYKKGDANGDGAADIADAVCIVNHVVGKDTPSYVAAAADANGDGVVDIADAVRVVNLVVGKIDALSRGLKADFGYPEPQ